MQRHKERNEWEKLVLITSSKETQKKNYLTSEKQQSYKLYEIHLSSATAWCYGWYACTKNR